VQTAQTHTTLFRWLPKQRLRVAESPNKTRVCHTRSLSGCESGDTKVNVLHRDAHSGE